MRRNTTLTRLAVAAAAAAAMVVIAASPAWAAASKAPPVGTLSATLDDQPGGTGGTLIVAATLADGAKLPAAIELPVPAGASVSWAGEVLGGPLANDPQIPYTVVKAKGYDLIRMTVSKAKKAQVELSLPKAVTVNGQSRKVVGRLPIPYPVGRAWVSVKAPKDAKVTASSPGLTPQPDSSGWTFYTLERAAPKAGTVLVADLTYTGGTVPQQSGQAPQEAPGNAQGAPPSTSSGSPLVLPALVAAIAALAWVAYMVFRSQSARSAVEIDDHEEEAEESRAGEGKGPEEEPEEEPEEPEQLEEPEESQPDEGLFHYDDDEPETVAASRGAPRKTSTTPQRSGRSKRRRRR